MEQNKIKDKINSNKDLLLEYHTQFFNNLKKIISYEDISKDLILNSDSFVNSENKPDLNQLMIFILKTKMSNQVNNIFGLNK